MLKDEKTTTSGKKNIVLLGLVSFINDTSSKIILPILPLFIKDLGGTGLIIGIITGISDSVASLFNMFAGYWSDRAGKRKIFAFSGYFVSDVAKFLFSMASTWPQVLFLRVAERLGKGVRSAPRDALLATSTEKPTRGRGFGLHRAMDSGGAVLGTLVAFGLFWYLGLNFQQIFIVAGLIGFASLIPLFFVTEPKIHSSKKRPTFGFKELSGTLKKFVMVAFLFALANFSYMFFVLRSESAFEGEYAIGIPILLYGLYNLSYTVFAIPAGIMSDRFGRRKVLVWGYGLFGIVSIGFVFFSSLAAFLVLFVLYGLNYALVNANERAFISDMADESVRGMALGTYHMATSVASLPAGLIAGLLWDLNADYTFIFGAVVSFTAVILLLTSIRESEISN